MYLRASDSDAGMTYLVLKCQVYLVLHSNASEQKTSNDAGEQLQHQPYHGFKVCCAPEGMTRLLPQQQ